MIIKDSKNELKGQYLFKRHMEGSKDEKNKEMNLQNVFGKDEKHLANYFKSKPVFVYVYKKTERLLMATYMVTDIMSDTDPLKNNVRESSLRLLSATLLLKDETSTEKAVNEIHEGVLRVVSLLDVAYVTGRITEMNASVLKREFQSLLDYINRSVNESTSLNQTSSFSPSFFEVEKPTQENKTQSSVSRFSGLTSIPTVDAFSSKEGDSNFSPENKTTLKKPHGRPSSYAGNVAKNERRAAIFNLLREKKEISVRDLANVVTDCSEKTLQRELLQLVEEGILNKEGERRWSRYSLVI